MPSPPLPPADAEQQAAKERNAAETAAMALFVIAALELAETDGAVSDMDLDRIRSIAKLLVKAIARMTLAPAAIPYSEVDLDRLANEVVTDRVTRDLAKVVKALRERAADRDYDPGELTPQRDAARDFATHVYGSVAQEVAAKLPLPPNVKSWVLKKVWISQGDSKVRNLHRVLHGRIRRFDEDFYRWPVTGQRLRYPGDWEAPIEATIHCRCVMLLSWATSNQLEQVVKKL